MSITMLKKPVVLSPYANLCCQCAQQRHKKSTSPFHRPQQSKHRRPRIQWHSYATAQSSSPSQDPSDDSFWPQSTHPSSIPTPYQIFELGTNAPYTKHRYYQLVKVYHPDRTSHGKCSLHISSLPGSVKMERYRLIVAAHELLSDPLKRKAYDKTGAGWSGQPERGVPCYHWEPRGEPKWSGFDTNDSPFRNATWEDWEKWYQRRSGKKQTPVYASNGGFLSLVVAVVILGAFGQSLRVEDYGTVFKNHVEGLNRDASKFVRERKTQSQSFDDKDSRLQSFLIARDPYGVGVEESREDQDRRLLLAPETRGIRQPGQNHDRDTRD